MKINEYQARAHTTKHALQAGQLIHDARLSGRPVTITFQRLRGAAPPNPHYDGTAQSNEGAVTVTCSRPIAGRSLKSVTFRDERLESFEPSDAGSEAAEAMQRAFEEELSWDGSAQDVMELLEDWELLKCLTLTEIEENEGMRTI